MTLRADGREAGQMRPIKMMRGISKYAEGSCLIEVGDTQVLCTASVDDKVPSFLKGTDSGWVTGEYGMLPRACKTRNIREVFKGRPEGRSQEIQRLVGRSLRSVMDLKALGERTITIDCDVLQADGGTRTAAINGGYVALVCALRYLKEEGKLKILPMKSQVAAISVGIVDAKEVLDLDYSEDSRASVDFNIVMTDADRMVEVQGTAEGEPFSHAQLLRLLSLAQQGISGIFDLQKQVLSELDGKPGA